MSLMSIPGTSLPGHSKVFSAEYVTRFALCKVTLYRSLAAST